VNNNKVSSSLKVGADLVVSALTVPGIAAFGSTITVSDTTKNQGAGPAGESATGFYLSANSLLDASDVFLGARTIGVLAASTTSTVSTPLEIPAGTTAGEYYIVAKADWADRAPESVESNNTRVASIRIGPDLAVTVLTVSASAVAGGSFTANDTTRNQGADAVPMTATRFYLSTNSSFGAGDVPIGVRMIGALTPGATDAGSATLVVPAGTAPGNWWVIAVSDGDGTVAESLENNNTRARTITVTAGAGS
jgi:subtilase family serine protease